MNTFSLVQYEQSGMSPDILGVVRYGCEDCLIPTNIPTALLGPGDLDEYKLVPAEIKTAPNSTLSVSKLSSKFSSSDSISMLQELLCRSDEPKDFERSHPHVLESNFLGTTRRYLNTILLTWF